MLPKLSAIAAIWLIVVSSDRTAAQSVSDYAVRISASVQTNPPQVTLSWPLDPHASSYAIYRKFRDDTNWGSYITISPANTTTFIDSNVLAGIGYEYRIIESTDFATAIGYIYSGINMPLLESRGKVALIVDASQASSLEPELGRLQQDLVGDGWTLLRHEVARAAIDPASTNSTDWPMRSNEIAHVKGLIRGDYAAEPLNFTTVFLIGHVPVPYSGAFAPDGHPDHSGAWPADVFYADIQGTWADFSVTSTGASDARNRNVPGDGKLDQTILPADVQLEIGRVDFSNLTLFSQSEIELLRRYLDKNHKFRHRMFQLDSRGIIDDNLGLSTTEPLAADAWRNFPAFFGNPNLVEATDWFGTLDSGGYLWGYGCGGGTFTSCGGVGGSADFATKDPRVGFTMFFGSYFGDWDSQDNFLRAALATPSYTVATVWAGRPFWHFHHMALGETIGFSTRLSQNNSRTYAANAFSRCVHIALMGDPTLRMHPVGPPSSLIATANLSGAVDLYWSPSTDNVLGYHVYRAPTADGPFARLTTNLIAGTNFTDLSSTQCVYMVRAVKLEETPSGSYYNPSQGIFQTFNPDNGPAPSLSIVDLRNGSIALRGNGVAGRIYRIQFIDDLMSTNWQSSATAIADSSGLFEFVEAIGSAQRFYRAAYP